MPVNMHVNVMGIGGTVQCAIRIELTYSVGVLRQTEPATTRRNPWSSGVPLRVGTPRSRPITTIPACRAEHSFDHLRILYPLYFSTSHIIIHGSLHELLEWSA